MLQKQRKPHLKNGASIKGKNSIFFPLKLAPLRIENNLKGH